MKRATFDNATTIVVMLNRMVGARMLTHSETRFWLLLSFLYKAIVMSGFIYSVYLFCSFNLTVAPYYLLVEVYIFITTVAFLSIFTMQVLGWQYYKEMSLLRKSITETDQSLMELDVAVDHRYIYIWIVGICTATAFNGLSFCLFYVYMGSLQGRNVMTIFSDLFFNITMYIGGIVVLDFMTHVCWLERGFKRTNDLLKKFFVDDCTTETEDSNNKMIVSWFSSNEVTPFGGVPIMKRHLCTLDKVNILQQIRYSQFSLIDAQLGKKNSQNRKRSFELCICARDFSHRLSKIN
ncbi:uncharacterized protein LOC143259636 isoform X1 [Megalopta genalis]|uniref:uncharacterized protein LOC143259636 isoform X1 n=1 Tax=Megalopta genalis TaxID=115081 RepID=UPI003FD1FE5A